VVDHASGKGRRGQLRTAHGIIETPFFMPVGTTGAMKGLTHTELRDLGAQILLCNTYHLHLQPGEKIVKEAGGLHAFIHWNKPILTDSGGYQVFSFGKNGRTKVLEHGVEFQSHVDGRTLCIGPEDSMRIQHALGSDIVMVFDECPPSTAKRSEIEKAVERTLRWAKECKRIHQELVGQRTNLRQPTTLLFGIVQGGVERDLREKCTEELIAIGFDGYALGGLAVGESEEDLLSTVDAITPLLPKEKPRYLMGVGIPSQLRTCVAHGIDMFDCVLPMRIARHGTLLLSDGSELRIQNAKYAHAHIPIDEQSPSALSREHSRSYLHHLFKAKERLAETIAASQNMGVVLETMKQLRSTLSS
jgi:queuine tRNA-ribosyltransferase